MDRSLAGPGPAGKLLVEPRPWTQERVDVQTLRADATWKNYLEDPDPMRIGICCSGGGIRSASYNLGALQVLRRRQVLGKAEYLSCVSGGGYTAIAHVVMASESLREDNRIPGLPDGSDPPTLPEREQAFFGYLPPWAPGSPEEEHLRNHTNYLAPGSTGKLWLVLNLLYGVIGHLLPFASGVFLFGVVTGVGLHRWLGPALQDRNTFDFDTLWYGGAAAMALIALAAVALFVREILFNRGQPNSAHLVFFQGSAFLYFRVAVLVALLLVGLPALLVWLETRPLGRIDFGALAGIQVGGLSLLSILSYLARKGIVRKLLPALVALLAPLFLLGPYVGITYWTTLNGIRFTQDGSYSAWPAYGAGISIFLLGVYVIMNEITPNMHWFYRERLATAFIAFRKSSEDGSAGFDHAEPPWEEALSFSEITRGASAAKFPRLVVCAAANLSDDVPPGRLASSFTFEHDFCGGPVTGYIPMATMETAAGEGVVTLPALMAISGAALSPSMGKMTRPGLRPLMALFNVRLGVWLPNPVKQPDVQTTWQVRQRRQAPVPAPQEPETTVASPPGSSRWTGAPAWVARRARQPGALYAVREALGLNSLRRPFVYVTDGGHFDNLGLVELIRRGCGQILCFDAAGDDLEHFHTLSSAIALARADLGVSIEIDLSALRSDDETGLSTSDHVTGKVTYPDGTIAVLVFAKAALTPTTPQDALAFREQDPKFPTHPTSDQLFNERKFESYRALGASAAEGAVDTLNGILVSNGLEAFPS